MSERFAERYNVQSISYESAFEFLKRHHYLSQKGNGFLGKEEHGLFDSQYHLIGVIVWGGVAAWQTLIGAFEGYERDSDQSGIWELNRLAMDCQRKEKNLTSWFVSQSIKKLRREHEVKAIISYADSTYHHGYIYQATNFRYYGLAPLKDDFFERQPDGTYKQVWRGSVKGLDGEWRARSRKHRYMIVYDKNLKVKWKEEPYPKGDNDEYPLQIPKKDQINIFDLI